MTALTFNRSANGPVHADIKALAFYSIFINHKLDLNNAADAAGSCMEILRAPGTQLDDVHRQGTPLTT